MCCLWIFFPRCGYSPCHFPFVSRWQKLGPTTFRFQFVLLWLLTQAFSKNPQNTWLWHFCFTAIFWWVPFHSKSALFITQSCTPLWSTKGCRLITYSAWLTLRAEVISFTNSVTCGGAGNDCGKIIKYGCHSDCKINSLVWI